MAVKKSTTPRIKEYDALRFKQRGSSGPQLVMFVAPVKAILGFAEVDQLTPTNRGPQREQKEARVQAIRKFIGADKANTIPTAVILAFHIGKASFKSAKGSHVGTLTIKPDAAKKIATIVDGQHRLFGIEAADPAMEVAVVGLLDADDVERAFQFLVINNKASKVPATHTKALLAKMKATSLANRLRSARLAFDVEGIKDVDLVNSDRESPFYKTIDWTTTPAADRMVQATAIELSLDYLGGLGVTEYNDRDVRRSVFLTIWKTIKTRWAPLWKKDSRLVSKVGIVCLTRFIADRITNWADNDELDIEVTDLEEIETLTRKIIQPMDQRFWTTPWAEKAQGGFDTAQGRERVMQAITQLFRNGKREIDWYTDIDIIDRSAAKD
jgi:DGQHR domain-containing protein